MLFVRYDFPLPNNGDRYDLSQDELHKLLDSVYERGYTHGVEVTNKTETTVAFSTINQAIGEIKLLENVIDSEKIPQSAYDNFRKNICAYCSDQQECLRSNMDIFECLKDENWEDWI